LEQTDACKKSAAPVHEGRAGTRPGKQLRHFALLSARIGRMMNRIAAAGAKKVRQRETSAVPGVLLFAGS
jgi:hypothetical protein